MEVHGCYFHACPKCYPDDQLKLADGNTAERIRQKNAARETYLRKSVNLEIYWECDIRKEAQRNKEMGYFFKEYLDNGPIAERDAYFGGRTGPMKLFETIKNNPGYKISYKDFTSLYPFTNFFTEYPVGHPEVKRFKNHRVNWTLPSHNPYKGVLKVLVVPPRGLDVPVLPVRFDERLLFPLCKKCAIDHPEGKRDGRYVLNFIHLI